ncbi:MAG: 2-oxoacid:acceptor oxidoreductase subunit alpha, partial [Verrucomicrobiota bacterium]
IFSGEAGQGIQTIQKILLHVFRKNELNAFATKEYMSRIRGGVNSAQLRVSSEPVNSACERVDLFVPLTAEATEHLSRRLSEKTVILGEAEKLAFDGMLDVPFTDIAKEAGDKLYVNSVAVGAVSGLLRVKEESVKEAVKEHFEGKDDNIISENIAAAMQGYSKGEGLAEDGGDLKLPSSAPSHADEQLLLTGAESVALGAVAGNCNFVCSYPMSPSTAVLTTMASYMDELGIVVEQVEDEIAAVNMALGAWYAGARALVTTSGGGFALMSEGISLAGMIETPLVIHLAQRPGPATGLPTRTEQGDLELALYAGHGEFPRIILAPADLESAFHLARKGFELADKFQSPVFILTDQYFIDSAYNTPAFASPASDGRHHVVETGPEYMRFSVTPDGISPRGVPGYGDGVVNVDSDEHDEGGFITEDLAKTRPAMNKKRAVNKLAAIRKQALRPELFGESNAAYLVIGWGSTKNAVLEALSEINRDDIALLHFSQLYPLPDDCASYFEAAEKIIVIEQNISGQFARLLERETGIKVADTVSKTNGLPFFVEDIVKLIEEKID